MASSGKDRRQEAAAAAAALRVKQQADARRRRTIAIAASVIFIVIIGVLIAVIVSNGSKGSAKGAQITPTTVSSHGGLAFDKTGLLTPDTAEATWPQSLAKTGGPVVVSVYFDFMCPWCGVFERTQAPTLDALVASGDIVLDSHPIAILDRYSQGSNYSSRAAAAAFAVAEGSPDHYFRFVEALMAEGTQPEENTAGLSNDEMAEIAKGLGVPQKVLDEISSAAYFDYTTTATELASKDLGQLQTPTILLNGKQLDKNLNWTQDGVLAQAIADAAKG